MKSNIFDKNGVEVCIPLMEWMDTEKGNYVPNCGNKVIYTEKYPFWVIK